MAATHLKVVETIAPDGKTWLRYERARPASAEHGEEGEVLTDEQIEELNRATWENSLRCQQWKEHRARESNTSSPPGMTPEGSCH